VSAPAAISITELEKRLGTKPVLRQIELDVPAGSVTAILGASGAGKTTLLRLIAGFERVDAGTIALHGRIASSPSEHLRPERRHLGYVAQEGALFPHLNVAANVGFGLRRSDANRGGRVDELLELVGLAGFSKRMPHQLSGGEQQRVALARALAPEPRTVLLDEPFSALDPTLRTSLRTDLQRALQQTGTTAVLVTHDQLEALSLADTVAILRDGQIIQAASPPDIYRNPLDPGVARFVGDANFLDAELHGHEATCALGTLQVANPNGHRGPGLIMLRPEQLDLEGNATAPHGRVLEITYYGHDADVHLALTDRDGNEHRLIARVHSYKLPTLGAMTPITVRGEANAYTRDADAAAAEPGAAATATSGK
jgi:iron(III) transport system ATP-binding protein